MITAVATTTDTAGKPLPVGLAYEAAELAHCLADAADVILAAQRELAAGNVGRASWLRMVACQMLERKE